MGVFEEINNLVSVKEIIEYYHKPLTRDNKVSCPFHNEKTPSLSVNEKDKMWKCFGCEKGGDGITFVKELKQISQIDAAKMIAQDFHLNVNFNEEKVTPKQLKIKEYIVNCQKNIDKAVAYLQKRGLSKDTLEQIGVGYDTEKQAVVIPYNRNFTYYQLRGVNSKWFYKPETAEAGPEPIWNESILYRKDTKPIFVVESPICAMSIIQYSGNAIALGGLGKSRLIEICKKNKPTAPLILSLDNDDKGQPQQEEIYDKLKDLGVKVIQFNVAGHCKDPNDLLKESPAKLCERIYQGNLQAKRVNQSDTDICDARDLYDTELEPTKWIVDGLIPEGLTILVAASKVGKSWMVMQLANAIIEKKDFLDKHTNNSAVLYYALEDSDKRFKSRMNKVWHNKKPSRGYYYRLTANTLDTGLIKNLTEIVKKNKDIKVIVFDTFQKIRGSNLKSESAYAHDYREMGILKQFCDRYGVSIILIHHTRKMLDQNDVFNMTSGSTAIIGASDTSIMIYKKKRTDEDATLSVVGRDVREQEIVINRDQDKGIWSVVGTPEEQEAKRKEQEFQKNPIAWTLIQLSKKQPGGWQGTAQQLVNIYYDLTQQPIAETSASIGKMLNDYDFNQRLYRVTKWEHSTKRKNNGTLHVFAPRRYNFWNEKS